MFFEIDVLIPILIHFYHHKLLQSLIDALNHLVMTNLLTNLLFLIVGLGYGVTFVLMKEILAGLSFGHNGASLYEWQLVASNLYRSDSLRRSL